MLTSDFSSNEIAPWETADGRRWLATFQPWRTMRNMIEVTLKLNPRDHAQEIRAAASMVIVFCRDGLWPDEEGKGLDRIVHLAARKLSLLKQHYVKMGQDRPELKSNPGYCQLLKSLEEELKILDSRTAGAGSRLPDRPPCTWEEFWCES